MKIKCLTSKFGNFIKDKVYNVNTVHTYSNKKPATLFFTDEDGDNYSVSLDKNGKSKDIHFEVI